MRREGASRERPFEKPGSSSFINKGLIPPIQVENHHKKQIENMSSHFLSRVIADGAISLPNWILNRFYIRLISESFITQYMLTAKNIYTEFLKKN